MPRSGWPFDYSDIEPYYRAAHELCSVQGPFDYTPEGWDNPAAPTRLIPDAEALSAVIFKISPKNHFHSFWQECLASDQIQLLLRTTATTIRTTADGGEVTGVEVQSAGQSLRVVQAKRYVLASGGIENARLLLNSDSVNRAGLGNEHNVVGRYFMEHLLFTTGYVRPRDPGLLDRLQFYSQRTERGAFVEAWLSLSQGILRQSRLQGAAFALRPMYSGDLSAGVVAARNLWQLRGRRPSMFYPLAQVSAMARDSLGLLRLTGAKLRRRHHPPDVFALEVVAEQAPNSESRVTLGNEIDSLGMRRVNLDWRPMPMDFASVSRAQAIIKAELSREGIGELVSMMAPPYGPILSGVGHHHIGTTRMSADPRLGAVDANLQVHGLSNLYVAGSSVFPTGGFVPPTMTIVALSLRLAEHLLRTDAGRAKAGFSDGAVPSPSV